MIDSPIPAQQIIARQLRCSLTIVILLFLVSLPVSAGAKISLKVGALDDQQLLFSMKHGRTSELFSKAPGHIAAEKLNRGIGSITPRLAAPAGLHRQLFAETDSIPPADRHGGNTNLSRTVRPGSDFQEHSGSPAYIKYLLAGMAVLLLTLFVLNVLLRHRLARQTQTLISTNRRLMLEISECRKNVNELKKYARALEACSDAIALFDSNHHHLLVNDAYLTTFAVQRNDLQQTTLQEVVGAEFFRKYLQEPVAACLRGEQSDINAVFSRQHHTRHHWRIHLNPCVIPKNHIVGYAINIRDISRQADTDSRLDCALQTLSSACRPEASPMT